LRTANLRRGLGLNLGGCLPGLLLLAIGGGLAAGLAGGLLLGGPLGLPLGNLRQRLSGGGHVPRPPAPGRPWPVRGGLLGLRHLGRFLAHLLLALPGLGLRLGAALLPLLLVAVDLRDDLLQAVPPPLPFNEFGDLFGLPGLVVELRLGASPLALRLWLVELLPLVLLGFFRLCELLGGLTVLL